MTATPALADTAGTEAGTEAPAWYQPYELRFGVLAHDASPISSYTPEQGWDINAELMLQPLGRPDWLFVFRPRPLIGGTKNMQGKTDQAYIGLSWEFLPFKEGFDVPALSSLFIDGAFGLAVHDGRLHGPANANEKRLGSRAEFRSAIDIGWRITDHWDVSLYLDHISNAGLFDETNQGLETWGGRLGYRF